MMGSWLLDLYCLFCSHDYSQTINAIKTDVTALISKTDRSVHGREKSIRAGHGVCRGVCPYLVSIMSYSLWRDRQVNAFMTTNRARDQCDTVSQAAWVVRDERVDLQINHLPLYCSGYRFEARDDAGKIQRQLDKYSVYQHLSRQSQ